MSPVAALAVVPLAGAVLTIVALRRGAVVGSCVGLATAVAITQLAGQYHLAPGPLGRAVLAGGVLALHAVTVILPGLYLTAVMRAEGRLAGIVQWVEAIDVPARRKAVALMVGFVPAAECLTGFGVSLFLSVPLFLRLFPERSGLRLSLLGMNVMPWGNLGVATLVGASLAGLPPDDLGAATSVTSSLVFPGLALLTLALVGGRQAVREDGSFALGLGCLLVALLYASDRLVGPQIAGVVSGMVVGTCGLAPGLRRHRADRAAAPVGTALSLFWPYFAVLAVILMTHQVPAVEEVAARAGRVAVDGVGFSPLLSPGAALAVAAVALHAMSRVHVGAGGVLARARDACLSVCAFLVMSQLMLRSGMVTALADGLLGWVGTTGPAMVVSTLLGMTAGVTAGSNLGANALLMPLQHGVGTEFGEGLLFAAIQNSAAGHSVFASIPVVVLTVTIARSEAVPDLSTDEGELLRFALRVLAGVFAAVLAGAALLRALGAVV